MRQKQSITFKNVMMISAFSLRQAYTKTYLLKISFNIIFAISVLVIKSVFCAEISPPAFCTEY